MFERSKLLKVFKISIAIILVLLLVLMAILFNRCSKSIENANVEETTKETQEKIVFDIKKAPREQKSKLRGHVLEYENQIYHYLFNDEKVINTAKYVKEYMDYNQLVDNFKTSEAVLYIYKDRPIRNLINMVFFDDDIDYDKYAFTDNYIQNHSEPLKKEFAKYYKENYEIKRYHSNDLDIDLIYTASYSYDIGIDRENNMVEITESKSIYKDGEDGEFYGSGYGKKGSAWEGEELCGKTKIIYFKYILDEKGYLDDIKFDHQQILMEDKLLDEMCP